MYPIQIMNNSERCQSERIDKIMEVKLPRESSIGRLFGWSVGHNLLQRQEKYTCIATMRALAIITSPPSCWSAFSSHFPTDLIYCWPL